MATVEILTKREQAAHFGLYRMSPGGNQAIFVRRKVGEPTDYMHTKSKKVKRQREVFGQASTHYSHLTSLQKEDLRHQVEEVEYIRDHGKTHIKVLQGRQLFISKDIHSLIETLTHKIMPLTICINSADPTGRIHDIRLRLSDRYLYPYLGYPSSYPYPGTNIFYPVPRLTIDYRVRCYWWGLATPRVNYYSLSELIKGLTFCTYPVIATDSYGPYCPSRPSWWFNWHYQIPTDPDTLWQADVHESDGTGWNNYRDYPMATFRIFWHDDHSVTFNIQPHKFIYPCVISHGLASPRIYWQVYIDPVTGDWSIDPPLLNCVYDLLNARIDHWY